MSPAASRPTDPTRCPLCGRSNQCAIEAGAPPQACWCMTAAVSHEALAAIPADLRNLACLCPECAVAARVASPPPGAPI